MRRPHLAVALLLAVALAATAFAALHTARPAKVALRAGACPRGLVREDDHCNRLGHPEGAELLRANEEQASHQLAPFTSVRRGAAEAASAQGDSLRANIRDVPGAAGTWTPLGKGALDASDTNYDTTQGSTQEGFNFVTGRVEDFTYDPTHGRLYAAPVNGGVWESSDMGKTWHSIGDGLPTQVVGSVAYSPAEGGTLIV